jgi:protein phosphatase
MQLIPGNAQWIGRREEQQDAFGFSGFEQGVARTHGGVLVVLADGMGGMSDGGAASRLAVQRMMAAYAEKRPVESVAEALRRALTEANRAVWELACRGAGAGKVGTTLVAAVVEDGQLQWVSAGDSRLYLYHGADGSLTQCTQDHNRLADLLEQVAEGRLSREAAESDPDGEALTSFVGMAEVPKVDASTQPVALAPDDCVLLCSDGIHGVLTAAEIAAALSRGAQAGAAALIAKVQAKGLERQDNATAALLEWRSELASNRPVPVGKPWPRRHWLVVLLGLLTTLGVGIWIGRHLDDWLPMVGLGGEQPPAASSQAPMSEPPAAVPAAAPTGERSSPEASPQPPTPAVPTTGLAADAQESVASPPPEAGAGAADATPGERSSPGQPKVASPAAGQTEQTQHPPHPPSKRTKEP